MLVASSSALEQKFYGLIYDSTPPSPPCGLTDISISVKKNQETEIVNNNTRVLYRPVAAEGAMLYILLTTLSSIDHVYRYSLDSFITFFYNSIDRAPQSDKQLSLLVGLSRLVRSAQAHFQLIFNFMRRGILSEDVRVQKAYMQFLLRGPKKAAAGGGEEKANRIDWLGCLLRKGAPSTCWCSSRNSQDLKEASSRVREWYNHVILPLDGARLDWTPFLVRCLRPDRTTAAVNAFVRQVLPATATQL